MSPATRLLCWILTVTAAPPLLAAERILSYHSQVQVLTEGEVEVTEIIRVRSEGRQIKRGIYREFPILYQTSAGHEYRVDFELLAVTRDGNPEPHHLKHNKHHVRIYAGRKNVMLPAGEYTYSFRYRTGRQLGFFANHDELYWNVTGNEWRFAMDRVEATVQLPATVASNEIGSEAYTGVFGARGRDYTSRVEEDGLVRFQTTRALDAGEGLTIVVTWPKGHVSEPSASQQMVYLLRDNRALIVGGVGMLLLLLYYLWAWSRVGRDPQAGVIVPRFEPPAGLSPAALRYIARMGFDHKAYAAALINAAVKGCVDINLANGDYTVRRTDKAKENLLARGELRLVRRLLQGRSSITLEQSQHRDIGASVKALKRSLRDEYHQVYFRTNGVYLLPGIAIALLTLWLSGMSRGSNTPSLLFMSFWLAGWSFTVFILIRQGQRFMAAVFLLLEALVLVAFSQELSWGVMLLLLALIAVNVLFYYLIKAPTDSGRKLLDTIEGFKLYLSVAEQDRLNLLNPPAETPELYERHLPYALALGVEQQWSERFAAALAGAAADGYRPRWYQGDHRRFSPTRFSSDLGTSLSSAVSSASRAPGSSSGSGGGGSSGGGGGGGGGGGW